MRTAKQIAASRANGTKSKGPITVQGKRNSSRNSIRHGLLAKSVMLEDEQTGPFLDFLNDLITKHQPVGRAETVVVENLAVAMWRRNRIWGMQKEIFAHDDSWNFETDSPSLRAYLSLRNSCDIVRSQEALLRYEVAFDREILRSLQRLIQLQEKRAKAENFASAERTQQPIENNTPAQLAEPEQAPQNPPVRN